MSNKISNKLKIYDILYHMHKFNVGIVYIVLILNKESIIFLCRAVHYYSSFLLKEMCVGVNLLHL